MNADGAMSDCSSDNESGFGSCNNVQAARATAEPAATYSNSFAIRALQIPGSRLVL